MGKTVIIGLTGASGCGKSTVSEHFAKKGIPIIDTDKIAREVTHPNKPCLAELTETFGREILLKNGELNRKKLGSICFSTKEKTDILNKITHKYIIAEINNEITALKTGGSKAVIIDAPQLFEAGCDKMCDVIIAVIADREIALQRIIERDNLTTEEAKKRLSRAHTNEFFEKNADIVIRNDSTLQSLISQADKVAERIIH